MGRVEFKQQELLLIDIVYESDGTVLAKVQDELSTRFIDVSAVRNLRSDGKRILHAAVRWLNGSRTQTKINQFLTVARVCRIFREWGLTSLPSSPSDWQSLITRLYEHWLTREDSRSVLKTRALSWNRSVARYLEQLRNEGIIPIEVVIPRCKQSFNREELSSYDAKLLGQAEPERVEGKASRLLVSISLSRSDAAYLEEVRDTLAHRRHVLNDCLWRWWNQVEAHFAYGQKILSQVDRKRLEHDVSAGRLRDRKLGRGCPHSANGTTEYQLGRLLALVIDRHRGVLSKSILERDPVLPAPAIVRVPASAPRTASPGVRPLQQINWMLGNLSHLDIAVAAALLIQHNARFTPMSLIDAKLFDKHGNPHLTFDGNSSVLKIEKPRSGSMKCSVLDAESMRLLECVVKMTAASRSRLVEYSSPLAERLFFCSTEGRIRPASASNAQRNISGAKRRYWIGSYFPELERAGLSVGKISFSRLRATEGVLEWFRTGSITAVTRKLGNTHRVVLSHYIPKPLLAAWNTRQIRRFQNLWLAVAAADKDWLLDVTDFHSLLDLHAFLKDMLLLHAPTASPLSAELHERFAALLNTNETTSGRHGSLAVPISTKALACLYLYQESALAAGIDRKTIDTMDPLTQVSPRQFLNLAELLRHQLPTHRDPRFRLVHESAIEMLPGLLAKAKWAHLVAKRGGV